jgi:STAM-binding protein
MLNADIPAPADAAPSNAKARYVVETLLIPTQHAPRNTCTADEENDMLRLTEERGFITLGWVSGASLPFSLFVRDLSGHSDWETGSSRSFPSSLVPRRGDFMRRRFSSPK